MSVVPDAHWELFTGNIPNRSQQHIPRLILKSLAIVDCLQNTTAIRTPM